MKRVGQIGEQMVSETKSLVFDLGAGSGRAMVAVSDGQKIELSEVHRFSSLEMRKHDGPYWNIKALFSEIEQGLCNAASAFGPIDSIGVDSWGLDYVLIGQDGQPLDDPVHYRHPRSERGYAAFPMAPEALFLETGAQILPVNTAFQMFDHIRNHPEQVCSARSMLMIADSVNHYLTGNLFAELTLARTSGLVTTKGDDWSREICDKAGLPRHIFPPLKKPGSIYGQLRRDLAAKYGWERVPVVAVACHDTASAVSGLPLERKEAFLICGSWSLVGGEVDVPLLDQGVMHDGFGNEGGVEERPILIRSLNGLHLLQKLRSSWLRRTGLSVEYSEMSALAEKRNDGRANEGITLSDPRFFDPPDMVQAIQQHLRSKGSPVPDDIGALSFLIYRGLVDEIVQNFALLQRHLGRPFDSIRLCGGGGRDSTLCQMIASELGRTVKVGPVEASSWGNVLMQLIGIGRIASLEEGRRMVANSADFLNYFPNKCSQKETR